MPFDDALIIALIVSAVIFACAIVIYAMRKGGKKERVVEKKEPEADLKGLPFKVSRTIQTTEASRAKEELRILDLEREILSDAIRRLYEAHAEGKITEEEREKLAETYKARMMFVKEAISKDENLVALHELETMQEDLIKLFSERFGELTAKVEDLRSRVEARPIKEVKVPIASAPSPAVPELEKTMTEEKVKKKRKSPEKASPRTEAEKRIEEIRSEVEKVLERLGQMEIEG